ncbi:cobyric acid synthase [Novispirillum itersonii]|uniref:cobyric acid synthase n=1 Tax=Novispirillum itersonii TaxID=189 RepID=UPI00036D75EB|nr:cobyric acid synthase [Novispirillum itersonii]
MTGQDRFRASSRPARALMFQGTGSDVGKSLLVAGLCRAFARQGLRVRPFKPQNMSNNAAVAALRTGAGTGEIGRAQALQARACGVAPTVDMNPVLLKPTTDVGSQVVVQGRVLTNASARDYMRLKPSLLPQVLDSFSFLCADADLVLIEGAGSAAEVNLRAADIANMGFAEAADVPVVLIGDIDRGGVLASVVGTHALISESERARTKGYLINKFRGDPRLFDPALDIIAGHTGLPCLGVVPWFSQASALPAEDAVALDRQGLSAGEGLHIVVPRLPRISNFDDLDPLRAEPGVRLSLLVPGQPLPVDADVVLLPGSKATRADLEALCHNGWDIDILAHVRRGGRVIGLCAGFQMLGRWVHDPDGREGAPGSTPGLGLLDLETTMTAEKALIEITAHDDRTGCDLRGYEMHMGRTDGAALDRPWFVLDGRPEGAVSADGRVRGSYLHGVFAADSFRRTLLRELGSSVAGSVAYERQVEDTLESLADHLTHHLSLEALWQMATGAGKGHQAPVAGFSSQ